MTSPLVASVFPLPWEIFAAAGLRTRLVRLDPRDLDGVPGEATRGLDPRASLLTAAVSHDGSRPVWTGGAADLKEIHGALLARLGPGGAKAFPWPLRPDRAALGDELAELAGALGLASLERAEELHARDEEARASLREWERERGEGDEAPCPARTYREALAAVTREGLLSRPPALPSGPGPRLAADAPRVGLLGGTELLTDLAERLEAAGARLAVDEWTYACAFVEPSNDLLGRYLGLGLPYGVAERARRMQALEGPRRVDGWVLVTSPFGASNLERVGFPRWLQRPVLSLEVDARRPVAGADALRLEAFLRGLLEARA